MLAIIEQSNFFRAATSAVALTALTFARIQRISGPSVAFWLVEDRISVFDSLGIARCESMMFYRVALHINTVDKKCEAVNSSRLVGHAIVE